jgi:dipeptidyl aminopeptidase/acylaminoacyl peptidase
MFARLLLSIALAVSALPLAAQDRWTPALQMQVKTIGDVVPSSDGKYVAWTQTSAVIEPERSEMRTHVWVAKADGSARRQVTQGDRNAGSPVFSPDTQYLYFQRGRAIERVALNVSDAEGVLDWKGSLGVWRLSPDGKRIAFTGRQQDAALEQARKEKRDWRLVEEQPPNHALYVMDAGAAPRQMSSTKMHVGAFSWAPDGSRIVFETRPSPDADVSAQADLFEIELATGKETAISVTRATESNAMYSPDGRYLAFSRSTDPPYSAGDYDIVLHDRTTGKQRVLPSTFDRWPRLLGWAPDSKGVYYGEPRGTRDAVYRMPIDGPPQTVFAPAGVMAGEHAIHGWLGYAFENSDAPPEAFIKNLESGDAVRVSAANADLRLPPVGKTEVVWWRSKDRTEVEGLLTYPVGYKPGTKYPLLLNLHGGPYGNFNESFPGKPGLYPLAVFGSNGYIVFRPNPRASTGYGRDFRFLNLKDWGGGDFDDVMSGVDKLIADGIVDPDRMAVMGWSYGGYLTAWTITHTKRFKAGAVGAGVINLWSQTGTADIRNNKIDAFGAPWDGKLDFYVQRSPLAHVGNVTTPTLILHGEADERVPISQGYEFFHALKRRGVEAKMVAYPRTPHGPREPKFMLDIMDRHFAWVEEHLK